MSTRPGQPLRAGGQDGADRFLGLFGLLFAVVNAVLAARSPGELATAALGVVAAAAGAVALLPNRPRSVRAAALLLSVALTVVGVGRAQSAPDTPMPGRAAPGGLNPPVTGPSGADPPTATAAPVGAGTRPGGVTVQGTRVLIPSSSPLTSDRDKLDLDTGHPGHGPMGPVLPSGGGPAELIVEEEELHTYDYHGQLVVLPGGGPVGPQDCRAAVEQAAARLGSIPRSRLGAGTRICVSTDEGRVALVRVTVPRLEATGGLELEYTTWER